MALLLEAVRHASDNHLKTSTIKSSPIFQSDGKIMLNIWPKMEIYNQQPKKVKLNGGVHPQLNTPIIFFSRPLIRGLHIITFDFKLSCSQSKPF